MQSLFNILTFFKVKRSQMSIFCIHFGIFFGHCSLKHFRCIQQAVCQIFSFYHQTHNFSTNLLDYYVYHVINLLLILELSEPNQYWHFFWLDISQEAVESQGHMSEEEMNKLKAKQKALEDSLSAKFGKQREDQLRHMKESIERRRKKRLQELQQQHDQERGQVSWQRC